MWEAISKMRQTLMDRHPDDWEWKAKIISMNDSEVRALYNILNDWNGGYGQYE